MTDAESRELRFLPVGLNLRGKMCVVIGGGNVGTRKVRNLIRAGACVAVVDSRLADELAALVDSTTVRWIREPFNETHLEDAFLVVAATDDAELNAAVVRKAHLRGALVCDASASERSEVIFGALHVDDRHTVAVFTDGRNPSDARKTRDRIAEMLDSSTEVPGAD